ncbi:MAG: LysR family transcriptional regulator [Vulcanimicrobiaceae bacterium]
MSRTKLQVSQLITFRALVRERNFTRTAEALRLTQPAVTQQVRALERHFGVTLVDIVGRRMQLTAAGSYLAERAGRLLDGIAGLERNMHEYAEAEIGELRLGATVTIGSYALAGLIARFRARHPRVALDITVENTRRIAAKVVHGELSLAMVEGPLDDPALEITAYQADALTLVVPPAHRLARRRRAVVAAELAGEAFVAREDGSGTRALFESAFHRAGVEPRIVLALPTSEGIVQAVEAGLGIAVVSGLVTRAAVAGGRLREVAVTDLDLRRSFRLVRLKNVTPSPATLAFAAIALERNDVRKPS